MHPVKARLLQNKKNGRHAVRFLCRKVLDRMALRCYNTLRDGAQAPVTYGPLAQLVRASGS